eukprot:1894602-Rhodomonas_salina.1
MPKTLTAAMRARNAETTRMKQVASSLRQMRAANIGTVTRVKAQCNLLPGKYVIHKLLDFDFKHDLIWIKVLWELDADQRARKVNPITWEPLDALAVQQPQLVSKFMMPYMVGFEEKTIQQTKPGTPSASAPASPLSVRINSPRGSASAVRR